ncbi:MAG: transposase, partial [Bacteroidetes bacterium]|nr:transposase [Bacteroidota bacterium]
TQVDPTNNLAERQLRPAVIARKISCGNRTPKGANTWKIIASIATTADQLKQDFIHTVDLAITRHLNMVRADEARFGIGPIPLNNFDLLEYGR